MVGRYNIDGTDDVSMSDTDDNGTNAIERRCYITSMVQMMMIMLLLNDDVA